MLQVFLALEQIYAAESRVAKRAVLTKQKERPHFLHNIIGCRVSHNTQTFLSVHVVQEDNINELRYHIELQNNPSETELLPDYRLTLKKS